MKRIVLVSVFLLAVLTALVWWGASRLLPPRLILPDGTALTVNAMRIGPFEQMDPPADPLLFRLLHKLPPFLRQHLRPPNPGGRSSGRSYYTDSDQNHALHLWFSLFADGKPVDAGPFRDRLFLADERGWLYPSCGWADSGSGRFKEPEQVCHSFSVFPRWQKTFDLVLAHGSDDGTFERKPVHNPGYAEFPATNWNVQAIPQDQTRAGTVFRLTELKPEPDRYAFRSIEDPALRGPPRWKATLFSRDPDGLEDVWHVIRSSYYDNYLNHSLNGLPPRLNPNDGFGDLQWRIQLVLAADHRCRSASNAFWELPPLTLPGPGRAEAVGGTNQILADLPVQLSALIGAGITTFTNGRFRDIETPAHEITGRRSSRSSQGEGSNAVHTIKLTRPDPHLVFSVSGPFTNYHFTCRAVDVASGEERWLGTYRSGKDEPVFQRLHNAPDLLEWSGEPLTVGHEYRFILGAHRHQVLDFFVAAPVLERED